MDCREIKVSVIIPVYNVEAYIGECLDSARNQTLKEIEIICVDDGSPDRSMEIVEEHAASDSRIKIIRKENGGLSTARNAGLMRAEGKYVYFLDSDDAIRPETLECLYTISEKRQLDNIYFGACTCYENRRMKKRYYRRFENYYHRVHDYPERAKGTELLAMMERNGEYRTSVCLQMPRRQFLADHQLSFYEGILHEDNLFSLQCILCAERAAVVKEDFYRRRVRDGSIMTADKTKKTQSSWGYYVCLRQMLAFIKDKRYDSRTMEAVREILSVMQRDAAGQIRGMKKEEAQICLPEEEKIEYCLLIQNLAVYERQNSLGVRLARRIKKLAGK